MNYVTKHQRRKKSLLFFLHSIIQKVLSLGKQTGQILMYSRENSALKSKDPSSPNLRTLSSCLAAECIHFLIYHIQDRRAGALKQQASMFSQTRAPAQGVRRATNSLKPLGSIFCCLCSLSVAAGWLRGSLVYGSSSVSVSSSVWNVPSSHQGGGAQAGAQLTRCDLILTECL